MNLCDAHYHTGGTNSFDGCGVLNGTSPTDWPEVLKRTAKEPHVIAAIGLHPWQVQKAPRDWQERFLRALDSGARAVGEIGLDRHFSEATFGAQCDAFAWQMEQATERNLPASIHCLKATGPLLRLLQQHPRPARGVHLHAYSGSAEEAAHFAELGAYFSFHADQLCQPARKAPQALRRIPLDRLLIESDAPDTLQPNMSHQTYLETAYQRAADIRGIPLLNLTERVLNNFQRYFLHD